MQTNGNNGVGAVPSSSPVGSKRLNMKTSNSTADSSSADWQAKAPATSLTLTGCWTPSDARLQPKGHPGLIQSRIIVESVKTNMIVAAIGDDRTITLEQSYAALANYMVAPNVKITKKGE
jgi:hypothetical protein